MRVYTVTLKVLNFWKLTSYCSLKPLWSGMGEVVPARTSLTLHPPSPPTVHQLSRLALKELTFDTACIWAITLLSQWSIKNCSWTMHYCSNSSQLVSYGELTSPPRNINQKTREFINNSYNKLDTIVHKRLHDRSPWCPTAINVN